MVAQTASPQSAHPALFTLGRTVPQTTAPALPGPRHRAGMPLPPQQCPPLFPDSRGPRTVLGLMPKDWERPFSGWACAYDASLGVSHASQAYIRRMQRLRRRQPRMRHGPPRAQLRFSSWEVSISSHCSCILAMFRCVAWQCVCTECGEASRKNSGCASLGCMPICV